MRNRRPGYRVTAVETTHADVRVGFSRARARSSPTPRELGAAGQVLLRRGDGVHRQPVGVRAARARARDPLHSGRRLLVPHRRHQQLRVESRVDVPRPARSRCLSGHAPSWWSPRSRWSRTSRSCTSSCELGCRRSPPRLSPSCSSRRSTSSAIALVVRADSQPPRFLPGVLAAALAVGILAAAAPALAAPAQDTALLTEERAIELALADSKVSEWLERYPPAHHVGDIPPGNEDLAREGLVGRCGADRAGGRAGHDSDRRRNLDRPPGRVEDGSGPGWVVRGKTLLKPYGCVLPRLPGRAMGSPPTAVTQELRPARAALVLRLARILRPRGDLLERPTRVPGARVLPRAEAHGLACGRREAALRPVWPTWAFAAAGVPRRLPCRAQRRNASRCDRRGPGGRRGASRDPRRRGAVREHAAARGRSRAVRAEGRRRRGSRAHTDERALRGGVERGTRTGGRHVAYLPAVLVFEWSGKWDSGSRLRMPRRSSSTS